MVSTGFDPDDRDKLTAELLHRGIAPDDVALVDAFAYFDHMDELIARDNIAGIGGGDG